MKIETQQLKCVLTKEELVENAHKMATAIEAIGEIEDAKKDAMASYKDKLSIAEHQAKLHARIERQGYETRAVDVEIRFNFDLSEVIHIRQDNYAEIKRRKMTNSEQQMQIEDALISPSEHEDANPEPEKPAESSLPAVTR